ncbi:MAG: serine hydrolase [Flavobacteriales bacterium]|nr:serine hydrolase [Flavobacteriales bacterium]
MRLIFFTLFVIISTAVSAVDFDKEVKKLDAYYAQSLKDWNVPGMAICIVKDGKVALSKGYGVKDVNTKAPVTPNSLFAVASNTKAFTAAALGMLVEEGKISWDDKVQKYLPWFELYDPYVSANLTIRDLLCHRSGLETFSGDLIWYGSTHSRDEVLRRAKYLKQAYGFRSHFGYQNILFLAAGEIIPVVTGKSWEEFVRERILQPAGMNDAKLSVTEFRNGDDVALPHNEKNGANQTIDWVNWDNIAPAGALLASANDMGKWLMLQLAKGKVNGDTLWSDNTAWEMWKMHTPEDISGWRRRLMPSMTFNGYGLGWELSNLHGKQIVSHGGGYDGMISRSIMVPEEGWGIIIVTNNVSSLSYAMGMETLDRLLGSKEKNDWGNRLLKSKKEAEIAEKEAAATAEEARVKDAKMSKSLSHYAGKYGGPMYGNMIIRVIGDQLAFQFEQTPLFRGTLRHWHYDTFQLNWGTSMMLPSGFIRFSLDNEGNIDELFVDVDNPDFDFSELQFKKLD